MELNEIIRHYIKTNGIKSRFVAESSEMTQQKLSRLLNGTTKMTTEDYEKICSGLRVDPTFFYDLEVRNNLLPNSRLWMSAKRKEKGLTQDDLANKLKDLFYQKVARAHISNIENGSRNPSITLAKQLAIILEVEWTFFFNQPSGSSESITDVCIAK